MVEKLRMILRKTMVSLIVVLFGGIRAVLKLIETVATATIGVVDKPINKAKQSAKQSTNQPTKGK